MVEEGHHVAWKDRLGLNRIWEQNILACCKSFGTDAYIDSVECFRSTLVNVKNGPQLKKNVDDYFNGELKEWQENMLMNWVDSNRSESRIPELLRRTKNEYVIKAYQYLFSFILQTLEDNGFGFYQSSIEMEEKMA